MAVNLVPPFLPTLHLPIPPSLSGRVAVDPYNSPATLHF